MISAALKSGTLDPADARDAYAALLDSTTRLNAVGPALAEMKQVHAVTDVTGFGLLGHALEMCRGSRLGAHLRFEAVPVLPGVDALARAGHRTGAALRNWASYGDEMALPRALDGWQRDMLCDPQTSGGLLVAVASDAAAEVLARVHAAGFAAAAVIGEMTAGVPGIELSTSQT